MTVHWVFHAFCTLPASTGMQAQMIFINARVDEDDVNDGYDNVVFINSDYHTKAQ